MVLENGSNDDNDKQTMGPRARDQTISHVANLPSSLKEQENEESDPGPGMMNRKKR